MATSFLKTTNKLLFLPMVSGFRRVWQRLIRLAFQLRVATGNIKLEGRIKLCGWPLIHVGDTCEIVLGDSVTLNSRNRGYHINMHSPVKLLADRPGAKIVIGANTRVHGTCIHAYESIRIGKNCLIAANCQIIDGNGHDLAFPDVDGRIATTGPSRPVTIGDSVWIGANTIVLPGSSIGRGSVIGANSVVSGDIPEMVVAAGNPARVIRDFREASQTD